MAKCECPCDCDHEGTKGHERFEDDSLCDYCAAELLKDAKEIE